MTDPIDDTQPLPSGDPGPAADATAPAAGPAARGEADASGSGPSLRADADRPADSGWREPPWFPPRDRDRRHERDRRPSAFALVVGVAMIAVGAYYFLDRTLGLALPSIQWSSVWPIVLIVIGGLILVRSFQRKS